MPAARIVSCDLTGADLTKATLSGSLLRESKLDSITGADALRGVTIGSDLVVPTALAVFGALGITVDDEAD